jgi:hypothetical protein
MGSAAIVVFVVILYYFTSYDPGKDPFRKHDGTSNNDSSIPFRENPFDVTFLGMKGTMLNMLKRVVPTLPSPSPKTQPNSRLEAAFMKVRRSLFIPA